MGAKSQKGHRRLITEYIRDNPGCGTTFITQRLHRNKALVWHYLAEMIKAGIIRNTAGESKLGSYYLTQQGLNNLAFPEKRQIINDDPVKALWQACRHHPEFKDYLGTDNPETVPKAHSAWRLMI